MKAQAEQPNALGQAGEARASSACPAAANAGWSGTGAAKLFDRVISVKSPNLTLSVTVRPATSARSTRSQA